MPDRRSKYVEFDYKDLKVKTFSLGHETDEQVKTAWIKKCINYLERFILVEDGAVQVNWNGIRDYLEDLHYRHAEECETTINWLLLEIGILSQSALNNWEVAEFSGMNVGPQISDSHAYFTHEEDARVWAYRKWKNTQWYWQIRRIDKILTKEEVCRQFQKKD